jgi:hypothetical protein
MKASILFTIALVFSFAASASAQLQTALGVTPVFSTVTVRPDVVNSVSIELWTDTGERVVVYTGTTLPIVPRDPHLLLKVVVDPSAVEGDLSKDGKGTKGEDQVQLATKEIAVLVNGKGLRVQNLSNNPAFVEWRTTDLDPTVFISTQSKVAGGYSHSGTSMLGALDFHQATPEGKGGSYSPALYVEGYDGPPMAGDWKTDYESVLAFQVERAPEFGIQVQSTSVTSAPQTVSTVSQPPADPTPVQVIKVKTTQVETTITFLQSGVDIKVQLLSGPIFDRSAHYHGQTVVSDDGRAISCVRNDLETMTFGANQCIEVFVNGQPFGTYGG